MQVHISPFLFATAAFFLLILVPVYSIVWLFRLSTRKRKSPLNIDLLRSPGQTLRDDIQEVTVDFIGELLMIPIMVLLFYSLAATYHISNPGTGINFTSYVFIVSSIGLTIYLSIKAYRLFTKRNKLRLGYECELFVGQGLNELLKYGFKVYHDFPADGFNIDHIAIGPTGVFAVETKGRSKQIEAEKGNWKVKFDGTALQFPSWTETEPVQQAKRQARSLSSWIASSTGEPQKVTPVLAIPGWWIDMTKPSDLVVYNGKNPSFMTKGQNLLSDGRIKAISHQIEAKCRDIKAESYKKAK